MRVKVFAFFLIMLSAATFGAAQTVGKDEREAVKKDLLELFEIAKAERYAETAPFLVYRGTDEKRSWFDTCDFNDPAERSEIKEFGAALNRLVWLSDSYEFSEYTEKIRKQHRIHIWRLNFKGGASQSTITFGFVKIKGRYAVADIDGLLVYLRNLTNERGNL